MLNTIQVTTQAAVQAVTEAATTTIAAAIANSTRPQTDKIVIKTQGKAPEIYIGGNYAKYNNYVTEIKHQFMMNNVLKCTDIDVQKISYAVIFLNSTLKQK